MTEPTPRELAILSRANVPISWTRETRADSRRLDRAASSCRFLGGFFAVLGSFPLGVIAVQTGMARGRGGGVDVESFILAFVDTLILTGPGVWYFIAASLLRRCQISALRLTLWIAVGQGVLVLVMMAIGLGIGLAAGRYVGEVLLPVILAIFFLPALGALMYELIGARRAMIALAPVGNAFAPIVVAPLAETNETRSA